MCLNLRIVITSYSIHYTKLYDLASLTIPLAAQSLEDIVTKALGQSSQIQNLEITKTNALLSLDIAQADETVDIAVTTGDITAAYDTTSSTYVFSIV